MTAIVTAPVPLRATILGGVLLLLRDVGAGHDRIVGRFGSCPKPALLDASGRSVLSLHAGANDVSHLAPGVYFVRQTAGDEHGESSITKVILTR